MKKAQLVSVLFVYLASSFLSYFAFSRFASALPQDTHRSSIDVQNQEQKQETALARLLEIGKDEPLDQECPINGKLYTNTEKQAWSGRRPLFVMIENSPDARPQSGLSNADMVFEALAEGPVTRFGAVFYCDAQKQDLLIAPVRSARTYFIDWASGFNKPLYVHVGGANLPGPSDALGQINAYGWAMANDINQFSVGYPTFWRDYDRLNGKEIATEHTMVTSSERLWNYASSKRKFTNLDPVVKVGKKTTGGKDWMEKYKPLAFSDKPSSELKSEPATSISYEFRSGFADYAVKWTFDSSQNGYLRELGGVPHLDLNNDKQLMAKNVLILFTKLRGPINELNHVLYTTTGSGDALLFRDGQVFEVQWLKKTRESSLEIVDKKGRQVPLARGLIWISVLNLKDPVNY